MNWKNKIPGCFGDADKKFAGHPADRKRAVDLLKAASEEDIGYDDYIEAIENWLESKGCLKSHIDQEMNKVKKLSSYF